MYLNKIIKISSWIKVLIISKFADFNYIFVFGLLGFLKYKFRKKINILSNFKKIRIFGFKPNLYNTLLKVLNNLFLSVLSGHVKYLELKGVGFKYKIKNNKLLLILGYSHLILYRIPSNILIELLSLKLLKLFSNNLLLLNKAIYLIKKMKDFDVYKGKGIVLKDEFFILKEGKKTNKF